MSVEKEKSYIQQTTMTLMVATGTTKSSLIAQEQSMARYYHASRDHLFSNNLRILMLSRSSIYGQKSQK